MEIVQHPDFLHIVHISASVPYNPNSAKLEVVGMDDSKKVGKYITQETKLKLTMLSPGVPWGKVKGHLR